MEAGGGEKTEKAEEAVAKTVTKQPPGLQRKPAYILGRDSEGGRAFGTVRTTAGFGILQP
jgi:hypothetical protein